MPSNDDLRILIVGASIAGPCAAYWLARAGGCQITVIERFPHFREGGQNIDIRAYGVEVMRKMGDMEQRVQARLAPLQGVQLVSSTGRILGTMKSTGDADRQGLVSEYEIFRDDLGRILYDLSLEAGERADGQRNRVKYVFGEQVSRLEQKMGPDGPMQVEFAHGVLPSAEYDLVIACDGATSRTRALGFQCGVRDHVEAIGAWGAYFTVPESILDDRRYGQGFSAVLGRFIAVGPDHDSRSSRIVLMGIHPASASKAQHSEAEVAIPSSGDHVEAFRQVSRKGTEATKAFVRDFYQDAGWKAEEILNLMDKSDNFYASEMLSVKPPTLSQGRMVLCGDAGYASGPTGTGTSMAMLGAYILAGEVATHRQDLASAIKAYEDKMQPFIKQAQQIPPGIPGFMAPQTAWGIQLRNCFFILICYLMAIGSIIPPWFLGFFSVAFSSAKGSNLPDYPWST